MKILEKIITTRANNTLLNNVASKNDGEFYNNFIDFIRSESRLLQQSQITEGVIQQTNYYDIENESNYVSLLGVETIHNPIDITGRISTIPKPLGTQIKISKYDFDIDNLADDKQKMILKNLLYKPFLKVLEKNIIGGTYFDKPLFETSNQITGTNDFDGLLKFVRVLKDKQDNSVIIANSSVVSSIIDTITKESYLTEYLLNRSIEGVKIIETVESPTSENGNILVGIDPTQICILLTPDIEVKKISVPGDITSYFQMFFFVNGGDVFNKSVGLSI